MGNAEISVEPPPDRFEQARELRKKQLVEAAIEVFSERGFEKTTTREIAKRAGCAEGLIHFYFSGKRDLLVASLEEARRVHMGRNRDLPLGKTFEEDLKIILLDRLEQAWALRGFFRTCMSLAPVDAEMARMIEGIERSGILELAERLEKLKTAGTLAADVDSLKLATVINIAGFHGGFFWQIVYENDREEVEERMRDIVAILSRNLQA